MRCWKVLLGLSARCIQREWRATRVYKRRCALVVQRTLRGQQGRRRYRAVAVIYGWAASTLQETWRGVVRRRAAWFLAQFMRNMQASSHRHCHAAVAPLPHHCHAAATPLP